MTHQECKQSLVNCLSDVVEQHVALGLLDNIDITGVLYLLLTEVANNAYANESPDQKNSERN